MRPSSPLSAALVGLIIVIAAACTGSPGSSAGPTVAVTTPPATPAASPTAAPASPAITLEPQGTPEIGNFPIGVYAMTLTRAELMAAGITNPHDLDENAGTFTMTFRDNGSWSFVQVSDVALQNPFFRGSFTVEGDVITFHTVQPVEFQSDVDILKWSLGPSGLVYVAQSQMDPIVKLFYTAHPWVPVK